MNSNQKGNQFGPGSKIDNKSQASHYDGTDTDSDNYAVENAEKEDDFLSGDNAKKTYPNNQNNPNRDYNEKSMSPGRNPNIGGDESEYETSTSDEGYDEESLADNTEGFANRRDNEEIDRHENENRYSSPTTRNRSEE
jgi:hypothetical protein